MFQLVMIILIALAALLYGDGYIAQFLCNYDMWQAAGGTFGTAPEVPNGGLLACLAKPFHAGAGGADEEDQTALELSLAICT